MSAEALQGSQLLPIGTVSAMTGINSVTLRAWERRYGLLRPTRTSGGHRLYTPEDVQLIEQVVAQLNKGIPISSVAKSVQSHGDREIHGAVWRRYLQSMFQAVELFDERVLGAIYNEAMSLYPVDVVTERLIEPLMTELGQRWSAKGEGSIAEEHFFSVFMRNKLGARFHHRDVRVKGPSLVAACLPGETHELGLLLFGLSAHARGLNLILLGADMPVHELPVVIQRTNSRGIVLSGSATINCSELGILVAGLTRSVEVPVFIGGEVASECCAAIEGSGGICVGKELGAGIKLIRRTLKLHS